MQAAKPVPAKENNSITSVKSWISQVVLGILGMLIWRDMNELRADVKQLLLQSGQYQVRIENLESDVSFLKSKSLFVDFNRPAAKKEDEIKIPDHESNYPRH